MSKVTADRLLKHVSQLCLDDEYSDVTFCVEDERFPAHKIILASSEYFRKLLYGPFAENQQKEIKMQAQARSFKALLKYIYNDFIILEEMEPGEIISLYRLAHMYNFDELTTAIKCYLPREISMVTVCDILAASEELSLDSLREECLTFLDKNASAFLLHDNFATLPQESLCMMLKRDTFAAPEIQIFEAVQDWSKKNCVPAADLDALLALVRLPLMSVDQLLKIGLSESMRHDLIFNALNTKYNSVSLKPPVNLASSLVGATVIAGYNGEELLNNNITIYDKNTGYCYHKPTTNKNEGIIVDLNNIRTVNHIRILLNDHNINAKYMYFVEVSVDLIQWDCVIDNTQYFCRSWQNLFFSEREVRYIRFFGTKLFMGKHFNVVRLQAFKMPVIPFVFNGFVMPTENIATENHGSVVINGKNKKELLNSSSNAVREEYTSHDYACSFGCIVVQLGQPYYVGSIRLLLRDNENRTYRFYVQTSLNNFNWTMAVDMRNNDMNTRSETVFKFTQRLALYVKIVGTESSIKEDTEFCCVRIECPANPAAVASTTIKRY